MSHHPDAAQVIGTAAVLLILGVIALYLVMVPYTHVQHDAIGVRRQRPVMGHPLSALPGISPRGRENT